MKFKYIFLRGELYKLYVKHNGKWHYKGIWKDENKLVKNRQV